MNEGFKDTGLAYNLYKDGENLKLEISLPGFKKENISAEYSNRVLVIDAKREKVKDSTEVLIWKGFKTQDIRKEFILESDYKEVNAKYFNGVLIVEFIADKKEVKKVEIL